MFREDVDYLHSAFVMPGPAVYCVARCVARDVKVAKIGKNHTRAVFTQ